MATFFDLPPTWISKLLWTPLPLPSGFPRHKAPPPPPPTWISKVLITTEQWPKHSTSSVNYFKGKTQSFIHLSKMNPKKNFLACTPLLPGFPDPLDLPPPTWISSLPSMGGGGGVWIISGIIQCCFPSICKLI